MQEFVVYKYMWSNGECYIGRSRLDLNRVGNFTKYKTQYVYKKMMQEEPHVEIIGVFNNIFEAFEFEHNMILETFNYNYNATTEDDWFDSALIYLSKLHTSAEEVAYYLNEYLDKKKGEDRYD